MRERAEGIRRDAERSIRPCHATSRNTHNRKSGGASFGPLDTVKEKLAPVLLEEGEIVALPRQLVIHEKSASDRREQSQVVGSVLASMQPNDGANERLNPFHFGFCYVSLPTWAGGNADQTGTSKDLEWTAAFSDVEVALAEQHRCNVAFTYELCALGSAVKVPQTVSHPNPASLARLEAKVGSALQYFVEANHMKRAIRFAFAMQTPSDHLLHAALVNCVKCQEYRNGVHNRIRN